MTNCNSAPTPAVDSGAESTLSEEDLPTTEAQREEIKDLPFLELIGCLWWLAQMTRIDIFVALQRASHWVSKPSAKLWRWLIRILKYLSGTKHFGLVYTRDANAQSLMAYVDASFADNPGCRSTAGWVYFINGACVAYNSHTITRVVTSSTEAECSALTVVGKENSWQREMFSSLMAIPDPLPPTMIYGDNTASISMISTGVTKRSRHFSIDWFKFKDLVESKELSVQWVSTVDNLADFMTKKLPRERFTLLRDKIMGGREKQEYFSLSASSALPIASACSVGGPSPLPQAFLTMCGSFGSTDVNISCRMMCVFESNFSSMENEMSDTDFSPLDSGNSGDWDGIVESAFEILLPSFRACSPPPEPTDLIFPLPKPYASYSSSADQNLESQVGHGWELEPDNFQKALGRSSDENWKFLEDSVQPGSRNSVLGPNFVTYAHSIPENQNPKSQLCRYLELGPHTIQKSVGVCSDENWRVMDNSDQPGSRNYVLGPNFDDIWCAQPKMQDSSIEKMLSPELGNPIEPRPSPECGEGKSRVSGPSDDVLQISTQLYSFSGAALQKSVKLPKSKEISEFSKEVSTASGLSDVKVDSSDVFKGAGSISTNIPSHTLSLDPGSQAYYDNRMCNIDLWVKLKQETGYMDPSDEIKLELLLNVLGYTRDDFLDCVVQESCESIIAGAVALKAQLGPFAPVYPWFGPELLDWEGNYLIRMVNANILQCMVGDWKQFEIMNIRDWLAWGVLGYIIVVMMQGSTPNPGLESKIPGQYSSLKADKKNNGKMIGLAIIYPPMFYPLTLEDWRWFDQQREWIDAFYVPDGQHSIHRVKWLFKFKEPMGLMNINNKPQSGMMNLSNADQLAVIKAYVSHIFITQTLVRLDGEPAMNMASKIPDPQSLKDVIELIIKNPLVKPKSGRSWAPLFPARRALFSFISHQRSWYCMTRAAKHGMRHIMRRFFGSHPSNKRLKSKDLFLLSLELNSVSKAIGSLEDIPRPQRLSQVLRVDKPGLPNDCEDWTMGMYVINGRVQAMKLNLIIPSGEVTNVLKIYLSKRDRPLAYSPVRVSTVMNAGESNRLSIINAFKAPESKVGSESSGSEWEDTSEDGDDGTGTDVDVELPSKKRSKASRRSALHKEKAALQKSVKLPSTSAKVTPKASKRSKMFKGDDQDVDSDTDDAPILKKVSFNVPESKVVSSAKIVEKCFPNIVFSAEDKSFIRGVSRERVRSTSKVLMPIVAVQKSVVRHLRYLKTIDSIVGKFPQCTVFWNDGRDLHFPLYCQNIFFAWKKDELRVPLTIVDSDNFSRALKMMSSHCKCAEHVDDVSFSKSGAMTTILKFSHSGVQQLLDAYQGGDLVPFEVVHPVTKGDMGPKVMLELSSEESDADIVLPEGDPSDVKVPVLGAVAPLIPLIPDVVQPTVSSLRMEAQEVRLKAQVIFNDFMALMTMASDLDRRADELSRAI